MQKKRIIGLVSDALKHVRMESCSFSDICCDQKKAPTFADGRKVTEENVTAFIVERTRLWRQSWVESPLEDALILLKEGK